MTLEQTLLVLKPDALFHSLTGDIITNLSSAFNILARTRGNRIGIIYSAQRTIHPTRELLEIHCAHLGGKPYYESTIEYLMGLHHYTEEWAKERGIDPADLGRYRRLIVYSLAGDDVTEIVRSVLGPTDPEEAKRRDESSIRARHGVKQPILDPKDKTRILDYVYYNVAHAADEGNQKKELKLWFRPTDFSYRDYREPLGYATCEKHYYLTRDGLIRDRYMPGSICIAAPSDMVWLSDLEILEDHLKNGKNATADLRVAVAKYRLNLD